MDAVLELVNAELVKSATTLLDRVCWKTETGQHWVVLGPNGAGKTSLVRAASGRLPLSNGSATLDSQDLQGIDPAELATRVALVSKSSAPSIRGGQRVLDLVRTAAWGSASTGGRNTRPRTRRAARTCLRSSGSPIWPSASSAPCRRGRLNGSSLRVR